jgi:hypothetical protein
VIWPERLLHIRVAMGSVDIFRQHPPFPTPPPPPPFLLPSQDAAVEGGAAAAAAVDIHVEASTCSRATDRATSVSATAILDALSAAASQASAMSFAPLVPKLFRVLHQAILSAASPAQLLVLSQA